MKFATFAACAAATLSLALAGTASAADISASASGWISSAGASNNSFGSNVQANTLAGFLAFTFSDWFEFALPDEAVTSATLSVFNASPNRTIDPDAVFNFYGATGFSFAGLTSGPSFGSILLTTADTGVDHYVDLSLNAAGISFLNAHRGQTIRLGGGITSTARPSCSGCVSIFGYTNGSPAARLTTSGGAVPEPAAWALMIGGFGLSGAALRRRRAAIA